MCRKLYRSLIHTCEHNNAAKYVLYFCFSNYVMLMMKVLFQQNRDIQRLGGTVIGLPLAPVTVSDLLYQTG